MYNIYQQYSIQWFPWVVNQEWILLTTAKSLEEAEDYLKQYGSSGYEYKVELASDSDAVSNTNT